MCNVKLGPKIGLVVKVTVLLTVVSIWSVKTFNDEKNKEGHKRLITTEMEVTTEQTHFHTEPIINVTALPSSTSDLVKLGAGSKLGRRSSY